MPAAAGAGRNSLRLWRMAFGAALVLSLVLALRPAFGEVPAFIHADKLGHAAAFAALAWLACRARMGSGAWVFGGLLLFGIGIEVAQSFTATRQAELGDVVADAAGLVIVLAWRRRAPSSQA